MKITFYRKDYFGGESKQVNYYLEINNRTRDRESIITLSLFFMSTLLHQSSVIFGVNLSLADIFCCTILILLIIKKQLFMPITPMLYFIFLSLIVLITTIYYVPNKFMYYPDLFRVMSEYIKLIAIFTYFIIGYNLSKINQIEKIVKWYSIIGIFLGLIAILFTVFNIGIFSSVLFFGDMRFRGLMNDPNYFSVLQVTSLVYFSRIKEIKVRYKFLAILITVLSVITSGSKTGIITLSFYLAIRIVEYIFNQKKKIKTIFSQVFFILTLPIIIIMFPKFELDIVSSIPSFARIQLLFTDFNAALSEDGSGRELTLKAALDLIQESPFIGVGISTYTNITSMKYSVDNLAHNTFLQLAAEWGIPLTVALFIFIFLNLLKAKTLSISNPEIAMILRDIIIILLVGSLAISLNNARVLWLFLGALFYLNRQNKAKWKGKI